MICDPCKAGDHCGPPGQASTRCPCQHLPRRTAQQSEGSRREPSRSSRDHQAPAHGSTGRTEPPDQETTLSEFVSAVATPGPVPDGLRRTLEGVSTVELIADWMQSKRKGAQARVELVGSILAERMGRSR